MNDAYRIAKQTVVNLFDAVVSLCCAMPRLAMPRLTMPRLTMPRLSEASLD